MIRQPCQQAAFGVLRDRQLSEDVAQEVAIALITNPPRIESDLYAYVRQCARNRALRSAEGRRREVSLDDARLESERDRTSVPTDPLAWQAVADAMLELKREYSEAVQLAAQGFSAKEIAASQRCSVHAVQNQILRGRQRAWKLLPAGVRKRYPMFGAGFTPRSVVRARNSRRRKSEEEE
ncbi:MAG: sigma-70 family RNA polymerase sigma factor [Deltaproteobacteria bacterium]|nr:sigma-70 family RNA polymerase sigma factor [Deltaproteobacteria bacterium]